MGRINFRLDDSFERNLRRDCKEKGYSNFSDYLREKIISGEIAEQPLNRATIESEIDELKQSIERINRNISEITKNLLEVSLLNSELSMEFLELAISGDEEKKLNIYNEARAHAKERLKSYFR